MDDKDKNLCTKLLVAFGIDKRVDISDVKDLKKYKSQLYGMCDVYSFSYKNRKYLISDDYSLMDEPKYIKIVFEDAVDFSGGKLIDNPAPQSDVAKYALGLDGTEYYLWEY